MSYLSLKIKTVKHNCKIQFIENSTIWVSRGYKIYRSQDLGKVWTEVGEIPKKFIQKLLARFKPVCRLFRLGIQSLIVLNKDNLLISTKKGIYLKEKLGLKRIHQFKKQGKVLPRYCNPLRQGITKDRKENIYYGEYFNNKLREPVSIYKSEDKGVNWKKFLTFENIRHIHAVQYDSYADFLWVATGDKDYECKIVQINPENKEISIIGQGSQRWRAVSLIFTKDKVYWGTDNPDETNFIFQWDRQTKEIKKVAQSENPFYYSAKTQNYMFFATTVEKNKKNRKKWSKILASSTGKEWYTVAKFKKDYLPSIFSYGMIQFPLADNINNKLIFTPVGLEKKDGDLLIGELINSNE